MANPVITITDEASIDAAIATVMAGKGRFSFVFPLGAQRSTFAPIANVVAFRAEMVRTLENEQ